MRYARRCKLGFKQKVAWYKNTHYDEIYSEKTMPKTSLSENYKAHILGGAEMQKLFNKLTVTMSAIAVAGLVGFSAAVVAGGTDEGKKLAFNKKKGNCLACHLIAGGDMAGNIAPPLVAMKARFPDKAVLRAQIADARVKNPNTIMPPFEAHGILTSDEIDKVVEFIHSL